MVVRLQPLIKKGGVYALNVGGMKTHGQVIRCFTDARVVNRRTSYACVSRKAYSFVYNPQPYLSRSDSIKIIEKINKIRRSQSRMGKLSSLIAYRPVCILFYVYLTVFELIARIRSLAAARCSSVIVLFILPFIFKKDGGSLQ